MSSQTSQAPTTGRSAAASWGPGALAGVLLFLLLNWVATRWLQDVVRNRPAAGWFLVLGAVLVGGATYLAGRYPQTALAAALTMALLVFIGLVLGHPRDLSLDSAAGGWNLASILRHGAYQPLLSACAAALLAGSIGARRHQPSA